MLPSSESRVTPPQSGNPLPACAQAQYSRPPPPSLRPRAGPALSSGRGSMGLLGLLSLLHSAFFGEQVGRGGPGRGRGSGTTRWGPGCGDRGPGTARGRPGWSRPADGSGVFTVALETVAKETAWARAWGRTPLPSAAATPPPSCAGAGLPPGASLRRGPSLSSYPLPSRGRRLGDGGLQPGCTELGVQAAQNAPPDHALHLARPQFPCGHSGARAHRLSVH